MDLSRLWMNASGDFYTTGRCLACNAPEDEAPMLFAPLGGENCQTYFARQPETAEEIELACRAAEICCVADVRYGGHDVRVIMRLGNCPEYCDFVVADDGALLATIGADGELKAEFALELRRRSGPNRFEVGVDGRHVTWRVPWLDPDVPLETPPST